MKLYRMCWTSLLAGVVLLGCVSGVVAWSQYDLGTEFSDVDINSLTKIAIGSNGVKYVVFGAFRNGTATQNLYLKTIAGDTISPAVDLPGPNFKEVDPDIAVDSSNVLHIVGRYRPDGTTATPYTVYYWTYTNGTWAGPLQISSSVAPNDATSPKVAIDRYGDVHVVWSQQGGSGGGGDLMYKKKQSGAWQSTLNVSNNWGIFPYGSLYPDIAIDRNGNSIHVVFHDENGANQKRAYYTKSTNLGVPGSWLTSGQWMLLSNSGYGANPYLCLDNANNPYCVWMDYDGNIELEDGTKFNGFRRWTGSMWTPIENWGYLCWPMDCAFDSNNVMRYIYWDSSLDGRPLLYTRTYNPATNTRSGAEMVCGNVDTQKVYNANMAFDSATGYCWITWKARTYPVDANGYGKPRLFIGSNAPTYQAPDPVTSFSVAYAVSHQVSLRWTNPTGMSYSGTMIRCKTTGYPSGPTDGTLVCDKTAMAGTTDTYLHTGLVNGLTYYYAAFAHDNTPLYAGGVHVQAQPLDQTCADARSVADGTYVELYGKVVSAIFPADGAIYVQEPDRVSGIRVLTSGTGLAVGDRVDVSGTVITRVISSVAAERQVRGAVVTRLTSGVAPQPLAMQCKAVGGGPAGPLAAGVEGGVGVNTVGLLVKIAGRVTLKLSSYIYVDDGSNVQDIMGRVGVMVKCPDSSLPVDVGDIVSAIGVVEGSVPVGWTANRRYIHIRDYDDLLRYASADAPASTTSRDAGSGT